MTRLAWLLGAGVVALNVLAAGCTSTTARAEEAVPAAAADTAQAANTLDAQYPGLSSGPLRMATLVELPEGTVLRAGELSITRAELNAEIEREAKGGAGDEVRQYPFFVLENLAIEALITAEARQWAAGTEQGAEAEAPIDAYLQSIADAVTVTDAEVRAFYDENLTMFEGKPYAQVVDQLRPYVLYNKRQQAVTDHVAALSERQTVELDAQFVAEAAEMEMANAVDEARRSGKPTMVDFGAEGCGPCDMMTPILAELQTELAGKCNIVFLPVREQPILAARYGIRSIPVQAFFDAQGQEVYRHVGFLPKDQILKKLAEMGVQ